MPINLATPLRWKSATADEQKMLRSLQGNILKGHGRDHTWNIFFQLGGDAAASKRVLRELGNFHVTDAYTQLLVNESFKASGTDGGTFCAAFLSAAGYTALGVAFVAPAGNAVFGPGMKAASSLSQLADPPVAKWEAHFQNPIHGMILVADDDTARGAAAVQEIETLLVQSGATIQHVQVGKALRNAVDIGIEHFGYVDGRSQPLILLEDIEAEAQKSGIAQWDAASPLGTALVPDPVAADPHAFGSFFIFRKLEQNVAGFKNAEQKLATKLGLTLEDRERAGALVIGRFEDGTPVTVSDEAKGKTPPNDFNYKGDATASRCPFHGHIRKTNPRGSGGFEPEPVERGHLMPRRGITFEDVPRAVQPKDLPETFTQADFETKVLPLLPTGGVGLLFMAYNAKLDNQYAFTQHTWANNLSFPNANPAPGIDGVMGQGPNIAGGQVYPKEWDNLAGGSAAFDFKGFVTMKGGEYFFAPSLMFLRNL